MELLGLAPMVERIFPTESRIICDPPVLNSDSDWVVLVKDTEAFHIQAITEGWIPPTSGDGHSQVPGFNSYRRGVDNLIVTSDAEWFEAFDVATYAAKKLNLLNKNDRITLFQAVMYRNKWGCPKQAT